jgi:putative oxidoreductase
MKPNNPSAIGNRSPPEKAHMSLLVHNSSHPLLSFVDGVVAKASDVLLLAARLLLAAVFVVTAYSGNPTAATLAGHGWLAPEVWSLIGRAVEFVFGFGLIFGVGTRYAALIGVLYVVVATVSAHLWWTFPAAQQAGMHAHFMKNAAIIGGLVAIFVVGAGRWSADAFLCRKL